MNEKINSEINLFNSKIPSLSIYGDPIEMVSYADVCSVCIEEDLDPNLSIQVKIWKNIEQLFLIKKNMGGLKQSLMRLINISISLSNNNSDFIKPLWDEILERRTLKLTKYLENVASTLDSFDSKIPQSLMSRFLEIERGNIL